MPGWWPDALASEDLLPVQLTPDLIELGQLPALRSCVGLSEQEAKLTANQREALNTRQWGGGGVFKRDPGMGQSHCHRPLSLEGAGQPQGPAQGASPDLGHGPAS